MRQSFASLKQSIKALLNRHDIYIYRELPFGLSLAHDILRYFPNEKFETVFDVGANIGQTTDYFLVNFPSAKIWCFEPAKDLHLNLAKKYADNPLVTCENCALSSRYGTAKLIHTLDPSMHHIASDWTECPDKLLKNSTEQVAIRTLSGYIARSSIECIDFLKIDTEGHDLEVLSGSTNLLKDARIGAIQIECGMNPGNRFHRSIEQIKTFCEEFDYQLFGIYEQNHEIIPRRPVLRRVNAVFVSAKLAYRSTV